jgi:hypothetical protein
MTSKSSRCYGGLIRRYDARKKKNHGLATRLRYCSVYKRDLGIILNGKVIHREFLTCE